MSTLAIVLVAVGGLFLLLFVGGLIAAGRRARGLDGQLRTRVAAANEALAQAHAQDKGWKRETVEKAARAEFGRQHPDLAIEQLHLVQVIDRPGTATDEAVFHVVAGGQSHSLTLGRSGSKWVAV